jgi:protein involved in polysaccharide export with SLBB domain
MDDQDQLRSRALVSVKKPPGRRQLKRTVFLLSAGVVGFTAFGAGSFHDRDIDGGLYPDKAFAAAPVGSPAAADTALSPVTETAALETDIGGVQDRLLLHSSQRAADQKVADASSSVSATSGRLFGVGDRLKITFYEHVDVEDAKWGRASSALRGIEQRPELSGEYAVQEDGTVSVPLLGVVTAAARSEQQVQTTLAQAFEKKFGRKGMVNVLLMERPPVYVLGPVKNPGSFKYVPGMTVLHAIALAGGLDSDQGSHDPWQKIEAVRTIEKRSGAIDAVLKLLARQAVLRAERDGSQPKVPARLVKLVGRTEAASLVDEQEDRRKAVAMARRERERAAASAVESAKQDLRMYAHTDSLDELVKTRQDRVEAIRGLVDKNIAPKAALSQVQAELSDAEQRRQDAFSQYSQAKQRLAQLENDALRARTDIANDLQVEIDLADRQIAENGRDLDASNGVLSTLPETRAKFAESSSKGTDRMSYFIVRQTATGPVRIESGGMTVLRPGDLVDIAVGSGEQGLSDQVAPTQPTIQKQQQYIERASRRGTGSASKQD